MPDQVFYVGATPQSGENIITGYVSAKFLTVNGKPIVDPVPGGSQNAHIYADASDKYKTRGAIANPNNYLIVPANYAEQQARAFAGHVAGTMDLGPIGQLLALNRMKDAFWSNGPQDFSGSLLGRLVAIAGIASQNPTQPAPPPEDEEQEQPDLQALSAKLPSSGDFRDTVALYNAIRSSRR